MTQHIELKTPCPDCRGRLTLSVRHTPLLGWHAVRLACENGCDLHWYYYDLPNGRAWFSTVEQCADYHDGVIRREGEENERILAFECPNCGECPHVSSKSIGRQTFPTATCRCASYWDRDLHSALCGWLTETKNRKNADILEKIGRSTMFRTEPDCPFCGGPVFVRIIETGDDRRWGFTVHHASPCNLEPLLQGLRPCDRAQEMADDFDRHWRKTVAAVKDTPDCPHCGRPPECAWDHTSGLWSVGCGKCDKPNNGVSDDILTAMASWREHTDAYRRNHDGEGLQNQLTEYWRKTRQVTA